jgi:surfeit locus 1 family protein
MSSPPPPSPDAGRPLVITPGGVAATLVLLLVCVLCVRLGFWQLDRRAQRHAYNEAVAARTDAPPVTAAAQLRDTTDLIFRTAFVSGRYDHDRSIALPGRSYAGAPGVYLLTPFRIDGTTAAVLVNRGWVPAADGTTIDFAYFADDSAHALSGILLPLPAGPSPRAAPTAATGEFRRVWYAIDERALRAQFPYPLLDAQLQLVGDGSRTAAPLPLPAPTLDEGPHLGYAIQWFSFAIIGFVGWGVLVLKARNPRARPGAAQAWE